MSPISPFFLPAITDARFFRNLGIKCYGYSILGDRHPTELLSSLAHGDDERIPVEALELSFKFYKTLPDRLWDLE